MKLFFYTFATCCFLQTIAAQPQSISGIVLDETTATPLIGVTIKVVGTNKGTTTDLEGRFTLYAEPYDFISFTYTGYQQLELMPDEVLQNLNNMVPMHSGVYLETVEIVAVLPELNKIVHRCPQTWTMMPEIETIDPSAPDPHCDCDIHFAYFPNPTVEGVTVSGVLLEGEIELVAANGAMVKTQIITDSATYITMDDLPSGIYYLHYRFKNVHKLIGDIVLTR